MCTIIDFEVIPLNHPQGWISNPIKNENVIGKCTLHN
jgi:hypothetical protein